MQRFTARAARIADNSGMDPGRQVGKYDIKKPLGKGATGTVYLAVDTFSGSEVALKVIEPEVFRDPEFGAVYRSQFLNEASLAGKLAHPHIVAILDAVVREDSGYIAMECVTGGDLTRHVSPKSQLAVADVLQIGFKCCGALEYAFREGIVHRDIKPANIMVVQGTNVKITDFGAAYLRKSQAIQTEVMGSPFYMSPEQLSGAELTHHSDMYCLGVVLYELLVGRRPFVADKLEDLIRMIVDQAPVAPSQLRPGIPRAIDRVILRSLAKRPTDRYATWAEFEFELSEVAKLALPAGAISDSEKFVTLKKVEMLSGLSDAELWELVNAGRWSRIERGAALVREGETGAGFYFLARGQAKVTRGGRLLNVVNDGECFGEMAYIRGGVLSRHATVESLTDLLVAQFEPAALAAMTAGAQLHLTRALARNLVDRLELANTRLQR